MRRLTLVLWFVLAATRVFAQDSQALDKLYLGTAGCTIRAGSGSPEAAVTGSVCDTYLQTNTADLWTKISGSGNTGWSLLPRVEAANVFTTGQTVSGTEGYVYFYETDQALDAKRWRWNATAGTMALQTINDAGSSIQATIFSVTRSGTAIFNSTASAAVGFRINGGATSGTFLRGDGTNYIASTLTLPNTATVNRVAYATGSNAWGDSASLTFDGTTLTTNALAATSVSSNLIPTSTDTYDIGSVTKLWNQAFISTINAVVFQQTTATLFGGYSIVGKSTGSLAADVATAATTINFGQSMTVGNWVLIRAHDTGGTIKAEYITIGSLVSGTTYNVTRDVATANSPDPAWSSGTPFLVLGASGDGRIEMLAFDGKPRIVFTTQGATATTQTDRGIVGNMNGYFGYASDIYGAAFGNPSAENITVDATNGFRVRSGTTNYAVLSGSTFTVGAAAGNRLAWDGTNLTLVSTNLTINTSGVTMAADLGFAASRAYQFSRPSGGFGQTGDIFGLWASSGGSFQYLELENKAVGSSLSNNADAEVILRATGWVVSGGVGSAVPAASLTLTSNGGGLTTVSALVTARDTIVLDTAAASATGKFRTGTPADSTAYGQLDANILAGGTNGEALGVAGSSTFANMNFYIGGTVARKATFSVTTAGTLGGKLAVFTKPDSAGDVAQAAFWDKDGSYVVGSPTGGSKGAGTINAQAVYDDNVLLTDWVFDLYYAGRTSHRIPPGGRLYSLDTVTAYGALERRLPWMPTREAFDHDRNVGGMISRLWFGQEQQQLYIQQLEARITALERR